jgi:hypothetical protein
MWSYESKLSRPDPGITLAFLNTKRIIMMHATSLSQHQALPSRFRCHLSTPNCSRLSPVFLKKRPYLHNHSSQNRIGCLKTSRKGRFLFYFLAPTLVSHVNPNQRPTSLLSLSLSPPLTTLPPSPSFRSTPTARQTIFLNNNRCNQSSSNRRTS